MSRYARKLSVAAATIVLGALVGCGSADPANPAANPCRQRWVDLAQLHSENGNPGGPVPAIAARWDRFAHQAARASRSAQAGDCGTELTSFRRSWGALEQFQYDLAHYDPRADLDLAELDLRHFLDLNGASQLPPGPLEQAFRVIRHETPLAVADFEAPLRGAAGLDLEDPVAVKAFLRDLERAKTHSVHVRRMTHPYEVIGDAELDEE